MGHPDASYYDARDNHSSDRVARIETESTNRMAARNLKETQVLRPPKYLDKSRIRRRARMCRLAAPQEYL